ncbi:hypothetical protein MAPG_08735 [Magnaporthiopsis poae ATCC 64411]|uniref:Uncharacterized protein n=1 Tax=Magnaporthiopsis poae (strain ATCC 64411 / 73-15) TaxID=644358 RepID=A0A0C4E847_MAGP6|nr:hypothetical protein MAPG_08735 [Magnaporthiopsis poae ATCC 64411]
MVTRTGTAAAAAEWACDAVPTILGLVAESGFRLVFLPVDRRLWEGSRVFTKVPDAEDNPSCSATSPPTLLVLLRQLLCDPRKHLTGDGSSRRAGSGSGACSGQLPASTWTSFAGCHFPVPADGPASTGAARQGSETEFHSANSLPGSSRRQQWDGSWWASRQADSNGRQPSSSGAAVATRQTAQGFLSHSTRRPSPVPGVSSRGRQLEATYAATPTRVADGVSTPTGASPPTGQKHKAFGRFEAVPTAIRVRTPEPGAEEASLAHGFGRHSERTAGAEPASPTADLGNLHDVVEAEAGRSTRGCETGGYRVESEVKATGRIRDAVGRLALPDAITHPPSRRNSTLRLLHRSRMYCWRQTGTEELLPADQGRRRVSC